MTLASLLTLAQLFVIAVLIADVVASRPTLARPLILVYAGSAVVVGLIGISAWLVNPAAMPGGRAESFDGQGPAQFAAILVPGLFVLGAELLRRVNLLAMAGAAVLAIGILASGTRSAWLAVIAVGAIGLVPRMSQGQRFALLVALLGFAALALVVPPLNDLTFGRLAVLIETGGTGRLDIWTIGLHGWTGTPFIGAGYGTFPSVLTLELVRATDVPTLDSGFLTPPIGSHSILVGTLVELGLVGMLLLGALLWHIVRPRALGDVSEAVRLGVLAIVAQGLFLDILGRKQLWLFIAVAAGLAAADRLRRSPAAAATVGTGAQPPGGPAAT